MTTQEGNKLIAEFYGVTFEIADLAHYPEGRHEWFVKFPNGECFKKYGAIEDAIRLCDFKYHTSWDWLMPVVEKICNTEMTFKLESVFEWDNKEKYNPKYSMEIRDGGFHLKGSDQSKNLIEVVYQSVIQFIQWYNQTKQ